MKFPIPYIGGGVSVANMFWLSSLEALTLVTALAASQLKHLLQRGTSSTWDNDSFKDQNAIEAEDSYVGSLESPSASGVIGADGNTTANDNDITGTTLQDQIPV